MKPPVSKRLLTTLCLLAVLLSVFFSARFWRQNTRPGRVHFERGLDYAAAKQIPQAEREWLAGIRDDPSFPDNYKQLGELYQALGRFPDAAAHYAAAARFLPQDGDLLRHLAQADKAAGDDTAAFDAARRAAALNPNDADTVGLFGILAASLNRPTIALPALKRAHALAPDNADFLIYLVRVEVQVPDFPAAEQDLTPFVQRHPDNAEACYLIAYLFAQKPLAPDTLQTALDYARRASNQSPGNAQAATLLGQLLLDARKPTEALAAFQQAQAVSPNSKPVLHGLIECYTRLGQPQKAGQTKAVLETVLTRYIQMGHAADLLRQNPADTEAALEMARLREENREWGLAKTYYEQAVHHAPNNPQAQAALREFLIRSSHYAP